MKTECAGPMTFWKIGKQEGTADFQGGEMVPDAGRLPIRPFERPLGILSGLAKRGPDPRSQDLVTSRSEHVLTQWGSPILAGYVDSNDAHPLRHNALFKTLLDRPVDEPDRPLASGSTLARPRWVRPRRSGRSARQIPPGPPAMGSSASAGRSIVPWPRCCRSVTPARRGSQPRSNNPPRILHGSRVGLPAEIPCPARVIFHAIPPPA